MEIGSRWTDWPVQVRGTRRSLHLAFEQGETRRHIQVAQSEVEDNIGPDAWVPEGQGQAEEIGNVMVSTWSRDIPHI